MKTTILSLFLVLSTATGVFAQTPAEALPTLSVTGNAELKVTPDLGTVRLGVIRQGPTAQAAQDQANRTGQEILNALTKIGVAADKVQTSRLTLTPIYAERRPGSNDPPKIVAYNASNIISILLDDLKKIGPAIDAGLTAGANQLEGVQFDVKNDLAVREQALRQAITEAKRKAEAMADALGVRLVNVQEVSEGGVSVVPRYAEIQTFRAAKADMAETPVSPGQLDVNASVTVRYRIAAK